MARHGWIKLKKISKHPAFISDMKFALELLHYVMTERIEETSAVRKAVPTKNPGKLMKDISVDDLATVVSRMDDDEYLGEVRIKLILGGKLVGSADVDPVAASVAPSSAHAGSPGHIPTASLLARPDSPPSPSPAARVTKPAKLHSITTKVDGGKENQQDEKEEEEEEWEGGAGEDDEGEVVGEEEGEQEDDAGAEGEQPDEDHQVEIQEEPEQDSKV